MYRSSAIISAVFICTVIATAVQAAVDETLAREPVLESRVAKLEAELAELRTQLDQAANPSRPFDDDCTTCCQACGWTAAYEATFLKFYDAKGVRPVEFNYTVAPRIWLGYTGPTGIGIRARCWDYAEYELELTTVSDFLRIDTYVFDLEVTNWMEIGRYWDALISAGWRYVEFEEKRRSEFATNGIFISQSQFNSRNLGPTLGGELYARVSSHGSLFATGRSSVVFGDQVRRTRAALNLERRDDDVLRWMWESQLGAEWKWEVAHSEAFFRVAAEVQFWDDFSGIGVDNLAEKNAIGFVGFTAVMGLAF